MTSPKKNDTAFLDIAREGRRGDMKRRWQPGDRDLARSRYKRRALIRHNRRSVLRPAAKSAKDVTKKERGMERVSDSDMATNCGMEDRQATPATKVTMEDRASSSPTLLAVARANKNKVVSVRARKEAWDKGSKAGETKYVNTIDKSQAGGRSTRSAEESRKERNRSRITGSEDKDGRWKRNTADNTER